MSVFLGYDCDGVEIEEFRVLRAIWSNDIDIEDLEEADPRHYCAVVGDDGKAYAISVFDWWYPKLIRERENLSEDDVIPVVVKPIEAMVDYEVAVCNDGEDAFYYDLDRNKLKKDLNKIIKKNNRGKVLIKNDLK